MTDGVYSYVCMANFPGGSESAASRIVVDSPKSWKMRRWEAADTNRLNRAHWRNARGNSLNQDLAERLNTLRNRCEFESANNPIVDGVIDTHQNDLIGPAGPILRVISESEEYNKALETHWKAWFRRPTLLKRRSGVSALRLFIRNLWTKGEFLIQKTTDANAEGPVKFRMKLVDPRRLQTPAAFAGDPNVIEGVRVSKDGVPLQYYILDQVRYGASVSYGPGFETIPADLMIHGFLWLEEDQQRGVPFLASSLGSIGSGRDYEKFVLEAAKSHAAQAIFFWTNHPDAQYFEVNEYTTLEPGTARSCPPGWQPFATPPTQPGAQYFDYLKERQREIGRPQSMPLMAVRLDASEHNMASARYDGQVYLRALRCLQSLLAIETLDELVDEVAVELRFVPGIPKRPAEVRYVWVWPVPPHVDPLKEANAERVYMENGTLTYSDAVASHGLDVDDVIEQRRLDNERLEEASLPPVPVPQGSLPQPEEENPEADKEDPVPSKTPGRKTPKQAARA